MKLRRSALYIVESYFILLLLMYLSGGYLIIKTLQEKYLKGIRIGLPFRS